MHTEKTIENALENASSFIPDVIISDSVMGYENKKEVMNSILSKYPSSKIILMSSADPPSSYEDFMSAVSGYFQKPLNLKELFAFVDKLFL